MTREPRCGRLLPLAILVGAAFASARSAEPSSVLKLRLAGTPKPNYDAPLPKEVRGRVVLDANGNGEADAQEEGVPGVSVSDGYSVAKTAPDGTYTLTPSKWAVLVNITRPSGFDVSGFWYKPFAATVDFALKRAAQSEDEYVFVHVSDTHVSAIPACVEGLSRFVTEVNALAPRPRFVVNSGDLVNLDKRLHASASTGHAYFRNYVGIMNHLAMPYYNVAGDHTDSSYRIEQFPRGDHRCGKQMFWEYLGPHFFSFEYGRVHFMSIDFGYHLGGKRGYATHGVMPEHVQWLKQDLAGRTPGTFGATTSEHDLGRFCPGFLELAKQQDIRLQLIGDDHIVFHKEQFVPYRVGGSLSGCWWNPRCKGLCPDLSPQGYAIYRVTGEHVECLYKGLGQRVAFVFPRYGAQWTGSVKVRAHLVQPQPGEVLHYSADGKEWSPMTEVEQPFLRAVFEAEVDSAALPDGVVELTVRCSHSGETRTRTFAVKNDADKMSLFGAGTLTFTVGKVPPARKAPSGQVEVFLNDAKVGALLPGRRKAYSFPVPAPTLSRVNTLRFEFAKPGDGMLITSPILTVAGRQLEDVRSAAVKEVRIAHWSEKAANWGGFAVGAGLCARPFVRVQQTFCFVYDEKAR